MFSVRITRIRVSCRTVPTLTSKPILLMVLNACLVIDAQACASNETVELKDTEGRRFTARSKNGEIVRVTPIEPTKTEDSFAIERDGYLVGVCPAAGAAAGLAMAQCRGLVCQSHQDCPPAHGLNQGTCINGLCIEPANAIGPKDAVMLCLAGTGIGRSSPVQTERFALGLNCGQPCKVPTPCRQP